MSPYTLQEDAQDHRGGLPSPSVLPGSPTGTPAAQATSFPSVCPATVPGCVSVSGSTWFLGLFWPLPWSSWHGERGCNAPCPQVLIDWINDVLVEERIIVKQLEEDLYDGQVLQKLLGESTGIASKGLLDVCKVAWAACPQGSLGVAALSPRSRWRLLGYNAPCPASRTFPVGTGRWDQPSCRGGGEGKASCHSP